MYKTCSWRESISALFRDLIWAACSSFSVSVDDRKRGRATNGVWEKKRRVPGRIPLVTYPARRPPVFSIVPTDPEPVPMSSTLVLRQEPELITVPDYRR